MSTNSIPAHKKTTEYPTMALTDTLILKDASPQSLGLSVYKLSTGFAVLHTEVGSGNESTYDIKPFGIGDFTMIKTAYPYSCVELTLSQCKSSPEYLEEKFFAVTLDGLDSINSESNITVDTIISTSTTATSTLLSDVQNTPAENGVLVLASTTNLIAPKVDPITVILDTINPAESTLILPSTDNTPEITLESIDQNTIPLEADSVINSDYSNNEEIKNADF
jgi:hypothetical protein